jgi:hypothetical protein
MAPSKLRPGDEAIAREEIEAFYAHRLAEAKKRVEAEQQAYDLVENGVSAALAAFQSGGRLPEVDVGWIALRAGGVTETTDARAAEVIDRLKTPSASRGRFVPDPDLAEADQEAAARNAATVRWLRANGYKVPSGAGRL